MDNCIQFISKNIVPITISSLTILTIGKITYNYTQDLYKKLNNFKKMDNFDARIFSIKI